MNKRNILNIYPLVNMLTCIDVCSEVTEEIRLADILETVGHMYMPTNDVDPQSIYDIVDYVDSERFLYELLTDKGLVDSDSLFYFIEQVVRKLHLQMYAAGVRGSVVKVKIKDNMMVVLTCG